MVFYSRPGGATERETVRSAGMRERVEREGERRGECVEREGSEWRGAESKGGRREGRVGLVPGLPTRPGLQG